MSRARGRETLRGFGESAPIQRIADDLPIGEWPHEVQAPTETAQRFPDVEIVREVGSHALFSGTWPALAIWTQRRMYLVDSTFVCRAVLDRTSLMPVVNHPVIGAALVYGQKRNALGSITELSRPLPNIGSFAVFSRSFGKNIQLSETSPVTRVVLRQHHVEVEPIAE